MQNPASGVTTRFVRTFAAMSLCTAAMGGESVVLQEPERVVVDGRVGLTGSRSDHREVERLLASQLGDEVVTLFPELRGDADLRSLVVDQLLTHVASPYFTFDGDVGAFYRLPAEKESPRHAAMEIIGLLQSCAGESHFVSPLSIQEFHGGGEGRRSLRGLLGLFNELATDFSGNAHRRFDKTYERKKNVKIPIEKPLRTPGVFSVDERGRAEKHAPGIVARLKEVSNLPRLKGEGVRVVASALTWAFYGYDPDTCVYLEASRLYLADPDSDPWLARYFRALALNKEAWEVRGTGWFGDMPEESVQYFIERIAEAKQCLVEAHGLEPQRPEPAAEMVSLSGHGTSPEYGAIREWFEKSIAADARYPYSWRNMACMLRDVWGGSRAERVALMLRAASIEDGTSTIGLSAIAPIDSLYDDDAAVFTRPDVYAAAIKCLRPYLAAEARGETPRIHPSLAGSRLLAWAGANKDPALVREAVASPRFRYVAVGERDIDMHAPSLSEWAFRLDPNYGAAVSDLIDGMDGSDASVVRRGLTAAQAASVGRPTPHFVAQRMAEASRELPLLDLLDRNERIALAGPGSAAHRGVLHTSVDARWDEDGQTLLLGPDGGIGIAAGLGANFRVAGKIKFCGKPGKPTNPFLSVVAAASPRSAKYFQLGFEVSLSRTFVGVSGAKFPVPRFELTPEQRNADERSFVIEARGDRFSLSLDGGNPVELVLAPSIEPVDADRAHLCIRRLSLRGSAAGSKDAWIAVKELTVERIR